MIVIPCEPFNLCNNPDGEQSSILMAEGTEEQTADELAAETARMTLDSRS